METIEERYGCSNCQCPSCEGCSIWDKVEGATEQKAIDEANPSDAVIMRILNAIGYEEESWIPIVRKNLKAMEGAK